MGVWYVNFPDIGCTGGSAYAGILDHSHYNIDSDGSFRDHRTDELEWDDHPMFSEDFDWCEYEPMEAILTNHVPRDEFELRAAVVIENDQVNEQMHLFENTAFWIHEDVEIKIETLIDAQGWDEEEETQKIYFGPLVEGEEWYRLRVYKPDGECTFNGCLIEGSYRSLYLYSSAAAADVIPVNVTNCYIHDGGYHGIWVYNRIRLLCEHSTIENVLKNGVYFTGNYEVGENDKSILRDVTILDCSANANLAEGGVYCSDSKIAG